eukprot:TRINITY_DN425_c0_g1_i1.p1 TRINITY_DN425_c0_g1~~TRINITY_DN425_c0_g1_i1.p1  ORF type:complete len:556 (+),score=89.18 TRINITY_DN425_c0_g1_i1:67-1734(+)
MSLAAYSLQMSLFVVLSFILQDTSAQRKNTRFLGARHTLDIRGAADILEELERLESSDDLDHKAVISSRVDRLEAALLPLYKISPKDPSGRLDANAARYVLHRLFSERHGWFVNGIELYGGYQNVSRVGEALKAGKHFSLRQLASFAATLETLVHAENIERLERAFSMCGFSKQRKRTDEDAEQILKAYWMFFLSPALPTLATYDEAMEIVLSDTPSWDDTVVFINEIRRTVAEGEADAGEPLSLWSFCLRVVEEMGERYGRWQNRDCVDLKQTLMQMETPGTGRVPLDRFWKPLLGEHDQPWFFTESKDYLRQLGALEGSESMGYTVVISNYLYSSGNCMASSRYYDVCCINECESLLGEIESRVEKSAVPHDILANIMASISSSTVRAPRELPVSLRERLEEIADRHEGVVPLHGRLFFQAMHHAFPRECPYPYTSLSQPKERDAGWIQRQTPEARAQVPELVEYFSTLENHDRANSTQSSEAELPWTDEEDLFMHSLSSDETLPETSPVPSPSVMPLVAVLLAGVGFVVKARELMARTFTSGSKASSNGFYV